MSFSAGSTGNCFLVYDFTVNGHCSGWMGLVAMALIESGGEVVTACRMDCEAVALVAEKIKAKGGKVVAIPQKVEVHAEYASQLASGMGAENIFFPNFDSIVADFGKKGKPIDLSELNIAGIWLRPILAGERLSGFNKIVNKLMRTPQGKAARRTSRTIDYNRSGISMFTDGPGAANDLFLFLLNGEPTEVLSKYLAEYKQSHLCDPWLEKGETSRYDARKRLGLDQGRKYFLHVGTSRPEKGLADACLAFLQLPSMLKKSVCLLRAGVVGRGDAPLLKKLEDNDQAFVIDRYLTDEEFLLCFAACDGVLMPYRDQRESSGILVHAAVHGRPVVASDYGVIGEWTKQYNLGLTFPHGQVGGLAQSIEEFLRAEDWCDDGMSEFSRLNSPQSFKDTIISNWAVPLVSQSLLRKETS